MKRELNAKDIMGDMTMHVSVSGLRALRWRAWVAVKLIRLAAWIMWVDVKVTDSHNTS